MTTACCVVGCHNVDDGTFHRLSFYRIPAASVDLDRRNKWISAISRTKSDDPLSPDYVPSIFPHTASNNNVNYTEIANMDFTLPEHKGNNFLCRPSDDAQRPSTTDAEATQKPSQTEREQFLKELSMSNPTAAVFSALPRYCESFVNCVDVPRPLTDLYEERNGQLSLAELHSRAHSVAQNIKVTEVQAVNVEMITRRQSSSKNWFLHGAGRITASKFKSVCSASIDNPSQSLVKSICYPMASELENHATEWGCSHKETALKSYDINVQKAHKGFCLHRSGLSICTADGMGFLAASPDAVIDCICCGKGVVEVKCPLCHRGDSLDKAAEDERLCLASDGEKLYLKRNHAYFYQAQLQMYVTDRKYCHFVFWTEQNKPHIEVIQFDAAFVSRLLPKVVAFHRDVILVELLSKYFTRTTPPHLLTPSHPQNVKPQNLSGICYCLQTDESMKVIMCKSDYCSIKYFHQSCMGLKVVRKKWMCPGCRTLHKVKNTDT